MSEIDSSNDGQISLQELQNWLMESDLWDPDLAQQHVDIGVNLPDSPAPGEKMSHAGVEHVVIET